MELRLLGGVEVVDGERVVPLTRTKERAVLVALALRVGEVVSEMRLFEALWGEDPPAAADKALQTHVSRLRKALGEAGSAIETRPGGYRLAPGTLELDITRAEELLARAGAADAEEAVVLLSEAAALWRGPSLGDLAGEAFAVGEAARLEELRAVIAERRVEAQLTLGRHATVIAELEALCAEHPLRERLWAARMLALAQAGRQAEALRVFQELRAHLGAELGLEPSAELRDLDAAIARQDPSLVWTEPEPAPSPALPVALPSGVVTFLLTDIEGSTALWEQHPSSMAEALARHDAIVAELVALHRGVLLKTRGEGDSTFSVFAAPSEAAVAALEVQGAVASEAWPEGAGLRVRAALHAGEAELRDGDYYGPTVNRAARLRAVAHGGQILCSQASAQLLVDRLPEGASLKSLGPHRLQDLARPETVFQLGHVALTSDFPPLQSLEALPNNLPVQLTSFVGREQEMARVGELLAEYRLVTLTGSAGCGKTRLALQLGADRLHDFADGVWLIDLASLGDGDLLVQTVATALGVRETPTTVVSVVARPDTARSLGDLVLDHLRSRSLLLVLDNCEHLLDAAAVFVEAVLRACPQLPVLATSREPLGIGGEVTWRVRSLSVPARHTDMGADALREYEAVRLFVDRARACVPSFVLTDRDGPAVAQICRRLDGIPLAIELAASRVEVLSPPELAERLDDRFRVLTGGSRTGLERHQTLRAAVDWSYDALTPGEQVLLGRLSVFSGGCTLDAAEAVCAGGAVERESVLDLLSRLVAKSLVVMDRQTETGRYRLLETIRQYARDKLAPEEATELRARHLDWSLDFARRAGRGVWGGEQMRWFDRLEDEEDNLRQALEWTIGGGDAEHALQLVGALGRFWMVRRRVDEGLRWTLDALALDATHFPYMRAQALVSAALSLCGYFGAYDEARRLSLESLDLFRELGIRRGTFWALHTVSISALFQGDVETAVTYGAEALTVARAAGHAGTLVYGLLNRADVAIAEGDFDLVDSLLGEALPILRGIDDKIGLVRLLGIQGYVAIRAGRYARAVPYLEETIVQSRQIGDESAVVWALANLGCVTLVTGDLPAARRWFDTAQSSSNEGLDRGRIWRDDSQVVESQDSTRSGRSDAWLLEGLGLEQGRAGHNAGAALSVAVSGAAGSGESTFLDIYLLDGLAELALAEGDIVRAARTFAEALHHLEPTETAGAGHPEAATFGVTFGMPAGVSHLVGWRGRTDGGLAVPDLEWIRRNRSAPRGLPVAGLGVPVSAPRATSLPGSAFATPTSFAADVTDTSRSDLGFIAGAPAAPAGAIFSASSAAVGDRVLVPSLLAGIAKVAVALGAHEPAARLFGAAEQMRGFTTVLHRQGRWILFEHLYVEMVAEARQAISDEAFDAAFAEGQEMSSSAVMELALGLLA